MDFFSVGTNDLTQYTLAMDRGHPRLAPQVDGLNPAVLGLIGQAVTARTPPATGSGSAVASPPTRRPSRCWSASASTNCRVSVPAIPSVKAQIRSLSLARCQELAARALAQDSAASVRALVPTDDDDGPDRHHPTVRGRRPA